MIIIEGPDGGGKTTLIEDLQDKFPDIPLHRRASEGVKGPVAGLYNWAQEDVMSWTEQPLSFYDRHPFISEYIYGPVIRGEMDFRFHTTQLRRVFTDRALIVLCLPPLDVIRSSVSDERDMPGVTTHLDKIWTLYSALRATHPHASKIFHWDFNSLFQEQYFHQLCAKVEHHKQKWMHYYD